MYLSFILPVRLEAELDAQKTATCLGKGVVSEPLDQPFVDGHVL